APGGGKREAPAPGAPGAPLHARWSSRARPCSTVFARPSVLGAVRANDRLLRERMLRRDDEDRATDVAQDQLGGLAEELAGEAGAGEGADDDQVELAILGEGGDQIAGRAAQQVDALDAARGVALVEDRLKPVLGLLERVADVAFELRRLEVGLQQ